MCAFAHNLNAHISYNHSYNQFALLKRRYSQQTRSYATSTINTFCGQFYSNLAQWLCAFRLYYYIKEMWLPETDGEQVSFCCSVSASKHHLSTDCCVLTVCGLNNLLSMATFQTLSMWILEYCCFFLLFRTSLEWFTKCSLSLGCKDFLPCPINWCFVPDFD